MYKIQKISEKIKLSIVTICTLSINNMGVAL
jgi:hypothetical protein